jgi:hypothetical protein
VNTAVALLSRKCLPEAMELILCAFENLQNATVSFVLPVRPSVWTQVDLCWTNFRENLG